MNVTINKNVAYTGLLTVLFLGAFYTVFSAPPGSQYTPGETLEPTCSPGDANCSVVPPAKSGTNDDITSIVGLTTPLSSDQGGTGTSTVFNAGTILFTETASGTFAGDNSNLFWDDANDRLGIGTSTPSDPLTVAGRMGVGHLAGRGGAPSIVAGAALGSSPTISITGTDVAGKITVTAGATPIALASIFTATFSSPFDTDPYVLFVPANSTASAFSLLGDIFPNANTTSFQFELGSVALTSGQTYEWNYFVIQ